MLDDILHLPHYDDLMLLKLYFVISILYIICLMHFLLLHLYFLFYPAIVNAFLLGNIVLDFVHAKIVLIDLNMMILFLRPGNR